MGVLGSNPSGPTSTLIGRLQWRGWGPWFESKQVQLHLIMKLSYALVADHAFLSIDKKVNIIGVFETINAVDFPVIHPKFVVVGSIEPSKQVFKMALNIVDAMSGTSVIENNTEREIKLPPEQAPGNFNFIIEIVNINFKAAGNYRVEIVIDGQKLGEIPLKVVKAPSSLASPQA